MAATGCGFRTDLAFGLAAEHFTKSIAEHSYEMIHRAESMDSPIASGAAPRAT
jgi:hypothetical protein